MVTNLFSLPDAQILANYSEMVYLCDPFKGPGSLVVVSISAIQSVVSMFPKMEVSPDGQISQMGKYSLMHHAYDLGSSTAEHLV